MYFIFSIKSAIDFANTRIKQSWPEPHKTSFLRIILKCEKTNSRGRNYALEKDRAMTRISSFALFPTGLLRYRPIDDQLVGVALQYCKNVCPWNRSEGNNHSIYSSCENFNEGFIKSYNLFSLRIISYHRIISDRNLIVCSFDFIKIKICIKCPNKNFKILKSLIRILFYCITIIIFFFIEVQFSMIVKIKMWKENSSVKFIQYEEIYYLI